MPPWLLFLSPWVANMSQATLCFKLSGVDCHCGGFLLGRNSSDSWVCILWQARKAHFRSSGQDWGLESWPVWQTWKSSPPWPDGFTQPCFPLLSLIGRNLWLSLLGPLSIVSYKGQIFFCQSLVIKWALQWLELSMACFLGFAFDSHISQRPLRWLGIFPYLTLNQLKPVLAAWRRKRFIKGTSLRGWNGTLAMCLNRLQSRGAVY